MWTQKCDILTQKWKIENTSCKRIIIFQILMLKLIPFFQSQCLNLMRPQLKIKKIVATVFYKFVHEHSAAPIVDCFNVGASTT